MCGLAAGEHGLDRGQSGRELGARRYGLLLLPPIWRRIAPEAPLVLARAEPSWSVAAAAVPVAEPAGVAHVVDAVVGIPADVVTTASAAGLTSLLDAVVYAVPPGPSSRPQRAPAGGPSPALVCAVAG